MSMYKWIRKFLGHPVACHTHFGTFRGVLVHCNRTHLILAVHRLPAAPAPGLSFGITPLVRFGPGPRPNPGPWGPGPGHGGPGPWGPGPGPWGPGPWGPPGGPPPRPVSGWHLAIPLAAVIGITAIGMHWW
ncbi:hypothetical protein GCM10010885_04170 [Alicyclobacillus cellulosilyticus]|uniref:Uncharacterized protein n=1 Tax=Alicyclobacillus cellulosilyticus TaxID=1003997 RepID=A0A917NFC8_9BACL|nr:hypothetical protein [Alicyclobacillus cellulosilyticus]GGI97653.1 hypothetical protein GCM10010885_04170 [Alicyclobacillus cellulosilyticus]